MRNAISKGASYFLNLWRKTLYFLIFKRLKMQNKLCKWQKTANIWSLKTNNSLFSAIYRLSQWFVLIGLPHHFNQNHYIHFQRLTTFPHMQPEEKRSLNLNSECHEWIMAQSLHQLHRSLTIKAFSVWSQQAPNMPIYGLHWTL